MKWAQTNLGNCCCVFAGFAFKSNEFSSNPDDIALVKGENVGQGRVLWEISKFWPRAKTDGLARYRLAPGDIVLAMDRPWVPAGLKYAWIQEHDPEALLVQRVARIRANRGVDQRFLHFVIGSKAFSDYIQNSTRGVSVPHISGRQIEEYQFPLPSFAEQAKIGSILAAYDNLMENNRRRMGLLEEAARQLYREWFVRLRFPGHHHGKIAKGIPEGWERTPLENAMVLQRGFDLPVQDRQSGTVPIYGSTGINGYHNEAKVSGPGIVTGRSGTLGEVRFVRENFWPLNTALWVKEFRRVSPLFALFLLQSIDLKQYNGGVSVPTLDRKSVHKIEILIPASSFLAAFDQFVSPLFAQVANLNAQNHHLRTARDLLLPRLMSGEIAV